MPKPTKSMLNYAKQPLYTQPYRQTETLNSDSSEPTGTCTEEILHS
jgi:hypothetical protein